MPLNFKQKLALNLFVKSWEEIFLKDENLARAANKLINFANGVKHFDGIEALEHIKPFLNSSVMSCNSQDDMLGKYLFMKLLAKQEKINSAANSGGAIVIKTPQKSNNITTKKKENPIKGQPKSADVTASVIKFPTKN